MANKLSKITPQSLQQFGEALVRKTTPRGSRRDRILKFGINGVKVLQEYGIRELGARIIWKLGRLLFAPQSANSPQSASSALRYKLQRVALTLWRDLPVQSFQPEQELQAILRAHAHVAETIVFAPSIGWDTSLFQRPQQLALALARQNCLVFYPETYKSVLNIGFHLVGERTYRCNVPSDVFQILNTSVALVHTYNTYYLKYLPSSLVIYDYLDDYQLHQGDQTQVKRDHDELLERADVILVTAEQLLEQVMAQRSDAILCPNAVDYDHFHLTAPGLPPDDLKPLLARGKPIIGYYGALARWFDYELVYAVAQQRNDFSFALIGSDYDGTVRANRVLDLPNIYWLGVRTYAELPNYLHYFDVAMIPFRLTPITQATSPIKLFEYFAGGKPVVTTALRECLRYPSVLIARDMEHFSQQLDAALRLSKDADYLQTIDGIARANTWDARAQQILQLVAERRQPCR